MLTYDDLEADQVDCIDFISNGEDSLIAADVGTGKTIISLTALDRALASGRIRRALVVAPLLVATDTWAKEPHLWDHLTHVRMGIACGDAFERKAIVANDAYNVVVTNYENLSWLLEQYPRPPRGKADPLPFDALVCDELDKLKDVSSNRFKDIRNRVKVFKMRIGLTGTLVPTKLEDVWGQTYMIDEGQSFGRSFYAWRKEHFYPTDYNQRKWQPFPDTRQYILDALGGLAYRLKATGLPEVTVATPHMMQLPPKVRETYKELEKQLYLLLKDKHGKVRTVDAANAAVLSGKLQQICAGFSYVDRSKDAVWHSHARFDWLEDLRTSLGNEQLLVFYHFTEELDELKRRWPGLAYLGGGVSNRKKLAHIDAWNRGELPTMGMHPASAGHGLNLQLSGACHAAFATLPWSGGMFKQVMGRLARRGALVDRVFAHTALFADTIDEQVFDTVTGRVKDMEEFLDDLHDIAA